MANDERKAEAEELKKDEDVRQALEQTAPDDEKKKPKVEAKHKFWIGSLVILFVAFGVLYRLFDLQFFGFAAAFIPLLKKLCLGAMAIITILAAAKLIKVYAIARITNRASQYNLNRVFNLVVTLAIAIIAVSLIFAD